MSTTVEVDEDTALIGHRVSVAIASSTGTRYQHGWLAAVGDTVSVTTGKSPATGGPVSYPRAAVTGIAHLLLDCTCRDAPEARHRGYHTI